MSVGEELVRTTVPGWLGGTTIFVLGLIDVRDGFAKSRAAWAAM